MLGRDADRAYVEQVLDAVADGPVGLMLEGEPGIGKTTVWSEAVGSARRRGYRVLEAAPAEPDAQLGFTAIGDLFDRLPQDLLRGLSPTQRRAVESALLVSPAPDMPVDLEALPRAVLAVLRRLSEEDPVVVAIDDEQWLDRPSARVLGFALRRLRDERIGVIMTRRTDSNGALWPELARGFGHATMSTAVLRPLEVGVFDRLLESRLSGTISRALLRRVHEASGGNPLYALAIADELEAGGVHAASRSNIPIPRTLTEAIGRRLGHVDRRASDALLVVALASYPTLTVLQAVIPGFALSDLDGAERAGVIEIAGREVRFTHPLLASAHRESVAPSRRRELHRALAEVVEGEEDRARHLALGAEAPDHQIAATLEQAAHRAVQRGAPETAADLLEEAGRLTPIDAPEARQARIIAAAEQHFAAGQHAQARQLVEELLPELPSGPIRARALARLGWLRNDDFELGTALLREALAEAGDDHLLRAEIELVLSEVCTNVGDFLGQLEHATSGVDSAERAADPGMLARALGSHAAAMFFNGLGIDRGQYARAIELEPYLEGSITWVLPSTSLGGCLALADDFDAARPLVERAVKRAIDLGEEGDIGLLLHAAALFEWEAGNVTTAERYAAGSAEVARQQANQELDSWVAYLDGLFAADRGELDPAWTSTHRSLDMAISSGDVLSVTLATIVLAGLELWQGKPDLAHNRLNPFRDERLERGFRLLGSQTLRMWSTDIEALIALGRLDDAERVLADLVGRADRADNPHAVAIASRCEALVRAARGDVAGALESIDAALDAHAERPVPLEFGRTMLEKGALERRAKRKSAAKRTLEEALGILRPLGAQMWIGRAQDELSRIGLRRAAASDGLTPAQTRVAELVAAGMSNQEIASTLYMSTRSVESHLTKIYREFGVRSRGQLIAALAQRRSAGPGGKESPTHVQTAVPVHFGVRGDGVDGADRLRRVEPLQRD